MPWAALAVPRGNTKTKSSRFYISLLHWNVETFMHPVNDLFDSVYLNIMFSSVGRWHMDNGNEWHSCRAYTIRGFCPWNKELISFRLPKPLLNRLQTNFIKYSNKNWTYWNLLYGSTISGYIKTLKSIWPVDNRFLRFYAKDEG